MKKILVLLLITISVNGLAQTGFPATQSQGTVNTKVVSNGGFEAKKGIINGVFADTTAANADYIDFYNGAQIYTRSDRNFWLRDSVLNSWVRMAKYSDVGSSGTDNTNLGSFYRLLVPSSQGIKGIAPGYGTLWDSTTNANSLTSKFDSATVFPQLRATVPLRRFGVSGEDDVMPSSRAVNMGGNEFRFTDGTANNYLAQSINDGGYIEYFLRNAAATKSVLESSSPGDWNVSTTGPIAGNAFFNLNSSTTPRHDIIAGSNMYGIDFNWKMQNTGVASSSYFRWNRGTEHTDNTILAEDDKLSLRSKTNIQGTTRGVFIDSVGQFGLDAPTSSGSTAYKILLRNSTDSLVYASNYSLSDLLFKSDSLSGGYTSWLLTKKKIDSLGALIGAGGTPTLQQVINAGNTITSGANNNTITAGAVSLSDATNSAYFSPTIGYVSNGSEAVSITPGYTSFGTNGFLQLLKAQAALSANRDIYLPNLNVTDTLATLSDVRAGGGGGAGVTDGDKGDITVSSSGATWTFDYKRKMIYTEATGTDANITAAAGTAYHLPAATLSTGRTIDVSGLNTNGDYVEFYNNEEGFVWSFTGATVYDSDGATAVTELLINANSVIRRINGKLMISKL